MPSGTVATLVESVFVESVRIRSGCMFGSKFVGMLSISIGRLSVT